MGKSKEIRKRTLLERLASERASATEREKVLSAAVTKLRAALVEYAKGDKWVTIIVPGSRFLWKRPPDRAEIIWVGDGNPENLAKVAIAVVFGKDHPLTGEVEK